MALLGLLGVYVLALGFTPVEVRQGLAQKIFYLHVPAAWAALLAFSLVGIGSSLYLWLQDPRLDRFAAASAEVGVVFSAVMLTTGPIWAKPIWGTWWTWDARLTTTLVLWLIYLGYLLVRASVGEPERAARFAAVIGIVGFLDVPIIRQSVVWWRTLHPGPTIVQESGGTGLPPEMLATLAVSLAVFGLLYLHFLLQKVWNEQARDEVARRARSDMAAKTGVD